MRVRLTLLYGGLFLTTGAGLLTITNVLVARESNGPVFFTQPPAHGIVPGPGAYESARRQSAADLHHFQVQSGVALAIMAIVAIGLGWLMAGRVLRPLRTITATARHISASNLHQRLALAGPDDELKELGDTIDQLLGRLERSFEAQRHFIANASHELRTPLARQRALAEVALADAEASTPSLRTTLQRVVVAGEQIERLIEGLLTLAYGQRGLNRREPIDLATVAARQLARLDEDMRESGIRADASLRAAPILGDPPLAERLVANLVDNAVRHNQAGGSVWLHTRVEGGRAALAVANTGAAIAAEQISLLFRPFQRLAESQAKSKGAGLGLSIVAAIAAAHDAKLTARPRSGGGLEITVRFPVLPAAQDADSLPVSTGPPASTRPPAT